MSFPYRKINMKLSTDDANALPWLRTAAVLRNKPNRADHLNSLKTQNIRPNKAK